MRYIFHHALYCVLYNMCVWFQFLSLDDIKEHKNIDLKCDEDDNAKVSFRPRIYCMGWQEFGQVPIVDFSSPDFVYSM